MDITLKKIELEKKHILDNLMQLYLHNISLSFPIDFDSNTGIYKYDDIEKYFEKYFTFSLLEYFGLSFDTEKIYKREQYWKKCLNTIEHGYNDN